jgi:hypothetical protein
VTDNISPLGKSAYHVSVTSGVLQDQARQEGEKWGESNLSNFITPCARPISRLQYFMPRTELGITIVMRKFPLGKFSLSAWYSWPKAVDDLRHLQAPETKKEIFVSGLVRTSPWKDQN